MSKEIVGDVVVGRHVYTGGDVNVSGSATVKRNLKVDGWLDAKNIKHFIKGLFTDYTTLKECYPEPKKGWVALVGATLPASIYIVVENTDGVLVWEDSGYMSDDLNVDLTDYITSGELASTLKGYATSEEHEELEGELAAHKATTSAAVDRIDAKLDEHRTDIDNAADVGNRALEKANGNTSAIDSLNQTVSGNTSAIETLSQSSDVNTEHIAQLNVSVSANTEDIKVLQSTTQSNTEAIEQHSVDIARAIAVGNNALEMSNEAKEQVVSLQKTVDANASSITTHGVLISENATAIEQHRSEVDIVVFNINEAQAGQNKKLSEMQKSIDDATETVSILENQVGTLGESINNQTIQINNKFSSIESVNARQSLWHEAHSIVNLHRFLDFGVIESSVFPEYIERIPLQLRRNGLIIMINTPSGWEAWQLLDAEDYIAGAGLKKLDWDNSLLISEINALRGKIDAEIKNLGVEDAQLWAKIEEIGIALTGEQELRETSDSNHDKSIASLLQFNETQTVFNTEIENHMQATEQDYIGVNFADGNGTLFERVIALEAKVSALEASINN